jgi:ferredoxin
MERSTMKISARNALRGTITEIRGGPLMTEVTVDLGNGQNVVAVVTQNVLRAPRARRGHGRARGHQIHRCHDHERLNMARAKLTFADVNVTATVPAGTRVIEISDKISSGIVYGCREGDCGTCLMKVVEGLENLSQPSVLETRILKEHLASRDMRLACQAQVLGDVTVRPA